MRRRRAPLLFGLCLALAGCTVGPDYAVPKRALVNHPQAQGRFLGADSPRVTSAPPPNDWWRLYDDPVLDGLIEQALKANTDLRVAAANLAASRAQVKVAEGLHEVHADVSLGFERSQISGEQFLVFQQIPPANLMALQASISYELDIVGRIRRTIEAAKADDEAVEAAQDLARVAVVSGVTRAYVQACAAGRQRAVAEHAIAIQARSWQVTERYYKTGRGGRTDATRALAQLEQLRANPPTFDAQKEAALYQLAQLLGRAPKDFPREVAGCEKIPAPRRPIPVGDGASLLARRPDVREAERRLAQATAEIGVATAELYPTINLGASAGTIGLAGDVFRPETNTFAVGPLLHWSVPQRAARARVHLARATADAALARFDGTVLQALRETETNLSDYEREIERNQALRRARDAAASAGEDSAKLYRYGRQPYLNDLDAQRTLAAADLSLAASDAQVALYQVELFRALGGGW